MNLPFYIARRYLISKKSHNVINIISGVSVVGVTIGTMALIIVLSVFNGFQDIVESLFNSFDPDLKITAIKGKSFDANQLNRDKIIEIPGVLRYTEVVEETALLKFRGKQYLATMKGVSPDYETLSGLDTMLIDGELKLTKDGSPFAILGFGIAYTLGIGGHDQPEPLTVYLPKRNRENLAGFSQAFNTKHIFPAGIFSIQQDFDSEYMIVPINFARELLEYENEVTSIEIGLKKGFEIEKVQSKIEEIAEDEFKVANRYQQQELLYKIMRSEKWAIFLILTFILIIATFNVIGSLTMLIIDKKKDISVLRSMGASVKLIHRIFLTEGLLISVSGAFLGIFLGGLICWLQQFFGLIKLNAGSGSFVIDSYPVKMEIIDFIAVFATVFFIGFAATWIPVQRIKRMLLTEKLS